MPVFLHQTFTISLPAPACCCNASKVCIALPRQRCGGYIREKNAAQTFGLGSLTHPTRPQRLQRRSLDFSESASWAVVHLKIKWPAAPTEWLHIMRLVNLWQRLHVGSEPQRNGKHGTSGRIHCDYILNMNTHLSLLTSIFQQII